MEQFNIGQQSQFTLADQAAQNAASQFNVGQANTVGMFNAGQQATMNQFNVGQQTQIGLANTAQTNAQNQFNAGQENAVNMFNTGQQNQNAQFNASNQMNYQTWNQSQQFAADQFNASQANAVTMGNAAGTAAGAQGIVSTVGNIISDRELKHDINPIGTSPSGIPIYSFKYNDTEAFGHGTYQGVMSDEVPQEAVTQDENGYDRVDYSQLDVEFKMLEEQIKPVKLIKEVS